MRADLPPAVAAAMSRAQRPALVFDRARIVANAAAIAAAARANRVTVLFAAKSFPHPAVREIAAAAFDGFDVASAAELDEVPTARVISIADPTGGAGAELARRVAATKSVRAARWIVSCETPEQVAAAPANADLAIRISSSLTGRDPAIGAVQDGSGHRRSRFGLDIDPERRAAGIRELVAAANSRAGVGIDPAPATATRGLIAAADARAGVEPRELMVAARGAGATGGDRRIGLHLHHGPVTATSAERFIATAVAALRAAREAGLEPAFLNLGGAWHGITDLDVALRELRDAIANEGGGSIELIIEPGRALTDEAGFACGRVCVARALDDRELRVIDLSRICHLRWSQIELVGSAPRAGEGRKVQLVGPTCFEDDVIGEWWTEAELEVGARVILRNVSGYAVAWNSGFHGVAPADVIVE